MNEIVKANIDTGAGPVPDDQVVVQHPRDVGPLFLANFVHQVVNPLNGVIGTLDNITDGTYEDKVIVQKINASRAQLEQCVSLIRNLAYLSDYFFEVKGKESLRHVRENAKSVLPQVIIESMQFFQVLGEKKHIKLELLEVKKQYKIFIRPELLKQIFINLFDNWLKYGNHNQTIKVNVSNNRRRDLVVEIKGLSVGFDNNEVDRLFELGYRSVEAKEKVAQSSGIGLFVCSEILKTIDSTISAVHNTARGESTFRIAIPKARWLL